ncbi:MAG: enoyl-CoA hydratase/isomerase family protein [Terriglobales bacterium]
MLTNIETSYKKIALNVAPPAARITLANPPLNIIDLPMMDELLEAIEHLDQRSDISLLVLAGSERAFSAGVDIAAHARDRARMMLTKMHSVIRAITATKKVTIAAVRGHCMGGGAELALVCDMVFCTETSTWRFPEINLACFPPVATVALSAVVGQKRAAELILTGRTFHGDEAFHMGLANDAVHEDELDHLVDEVGQRIVSLSPAALAFAKKAFYSCGPAELDKRLENVEAIYFDELMRTEDAQEGIASFLEKRRPVWKGR